MNKKSLESAFPHVDNILITKFDFYHDDVTIPFRLESNNGSWSTSSFHGLVRIDHKDCHDTLGTICLQYFHNHNSYI